MTKAEKLQPESTFFQAGKTAYKLGVNNVANPYNEEPYHRLWNNGWLQAQREDKPRNSRRDKRSYKKPQRGQAVKRMAATK